MPIFRKGLTRIVITFNHGDRLKSGLVQAKHKTSPSCKKFDGIHARSFNWIRESLQAPLEFVQLSVADCAKSAPKFAALSSLAFEAAD